MSNLDAIEREVRSQERWIFFQRWIKKPKQVGTLAPISASLATLVTSFIEPQHRVVELGAGTGRLTRILCKKINPENLIAVELEKEYCVFLNTTLSQVLSLVPKIIEGDASHLREIIPTNWIGKIDTIVSVLPLMYMSPSIRDIIINEALFCLAPLGSILHVTYSPWSPLRHRDDIEQIMLKICFKNIPPGYIWRFRAAIPDNVFPSINSIKAPPAVET